MLEVRTSFEDLSLTVQRIQLKPDDMLVVCFDGILSDDHAAQIKRMLDARQLPVPVLVLDNRMSIKVVSKEAADALATDDDKPEPPPDRFLCGHA